MWNPGAAFCAILLFLPPHAGSPDPDLAAISRWVSQQTGLRQPSAMPKLLYESSAELASRRSSGRETVALYEPSTATIHVAEDWRSGSVAAQSVLVHEMVHHLQRESGRRYACPEEQEEQAYAAQDAWLALHGTSLEREFGIDPFTRLVASLCPY